MSVFRVSPFAERFYEQVFCVSSEDTGKRKCSFSFISTDKLYPFKQNKIKLKLKQESKQTSKDILKLSSNYLFILVVVVVVGVL